LKTVGVGSVAAAGLSALAGEAVVP
jgi:hypothetical protein